MLLTFGDCLFYSIFPSMKPLSQSAIAGAVDALTRRRNGYRHLIAEQVSSSSPVVNPASHSQPIEGLHYTNSLAVVLLELGLDCDWFRVLRTQSS